MFKEILDTSLNRGNSAEITSFLMPDYTAVVDIGGASTITDYTPPANGWLYFQGGSTQVTMYYDSAKTNAVAMGAYLATGSSNASCFIPVIKGHTYYFNGHTVTFRRFFPCLGG